MIRQFLLAPLMNEYKGVATRITIEKVLDLEINYLVEPKFIKEFHIFNSKKSSQYGFNLSDIYGR